MSFAYKRYSDTCTLKESRHATIHVLLVGDLLFKPAKYFLKVMFVNPLLHWSETIILWMAASNVAGDQFLFSFMVLLAN